MRLKSTAFRLIDQKRDQTQNKKIHQTVLLRAIGIGNPVNSLH